MSSNILTIVSIVTKTLVYFLSKRKISRHSDYCSFDVELLPKGNDFYVIRVKNCGHIDVDSQNFDDILHEIPKYCFAQMLDSQRLTKHVKTITCVVNEEDRDREQIYEFRWYDRKLILSSNSEESKRKRSDGRKTYLTLRFECRIPFGDYCDCRDSLIESLVYLAELDKRAEYVFRSEDKILWKNKVESDDEICDAYKIFGGAIMTIVKNSTNQRFRSKCLLTAGVNDVSDIADAVTNQIALLMRKKERDEKEKKERSGSKRRKS